MARFVCEGGQPEIPPKDSIKGADSGGVTITSVCPRQTNDGEMQEDEERGRSSNLNFEEVMLAESRKKESDEKQK